MLEVVLVVTIVLCGLVAGLLFGFAVVAMPGIGSLEDREFIRAFQVMDGVIQDNQPLFMVAWVGSVLGVVVTAVVGVIRLDGWELVMLLAAVAVYLAGVQVPTATINIPLNNRIQTVQVDTATTAELASERGAFEERWNRWNGIRAALAIVTVVLFLVVLLRL